MKMEKKIELEVMTRLKDRAENIIYAGTKTISGSTFITFSAWKRKLNLK